MVFRKYDDHNRPEKIQRGYYNRKKDTRFVYIFGHADNHGYMCPRKYQPFLHNGKVFSTIVHFYYYHKHITDVNASKQMLRERFPKDVLKISRKYPLISKLENKWNTIDVEIMELAVRSALRYNSKAKTALLKTGVKPIVYTTNNPSKWGQSRSNEGYNALGKIYMKIRDEMLKVNGQNTMFDFDTPPYIDLDQVNAYIPETHTRLHVKVFNGRDRTI
jgi:ribA/ribD-fused uncharacterized protein